MRKHIIGGEPMETQNKKKKQAVMEAVLLSLMAVQALVYISYLVENMRIPVWMVYVSVFYFILWLGLVLFFPRLPGLIRKITKIISITQLIAVAIVMISSFPYLNYFRYLSYPFAMVYSASFLLHDAVLAGVTPFPEDWYMGTMLVLMIIALFATVRCLLAHNNQDFEEEDE